MFRIIFVIFLLDFCSSMPINRTARAVDPEESVSPTKKPRLEEECYFAKIRKTDFETEPRPEKSKVSLDCKGTLQSLSTYFLDPVNTATTGETNATALLLCRGAGECSLDFFDPVTVKKWENVKICDHHGDELLRKWDDTKTFKYNHIERHQLGVTRKDACSMTQKICPVHGSRPINHLRKLTIQESDAILKTIGYLVHPGIPICERHVEKVKELVSSASGMVHDTDDTVDNVDDATCASDPNYYFPQKTTKTPASEALKKFAKFANVDRVCFPKLSFGEIEDETRRKKACGVKKMIDVMCEIVAPGSPEELKKVVLAKYGDKENWSSSNKLDKVLLQVASQFSVAGNRQEKLIILGLVANSVSLSKIQEYIPSLSRYMYSAARKFARRKRDSTLPKSIKRERYNAEAVQHFISFITSPNIMIGLPYGFRNVKTSDGVKHVILDSIRQQSSSEIYLMYSKYLKENNQEHLSLAKSTVFSMLEICAATDRKATTCVDYYIANGLQAFDDLHKTLDGWNEEQLTADDILKYLKSGLFEALEYIRTDYLLHIKKNSHIADHCATFALSDPTDAKLSSSCSTGKQQHKHDFKCDRCEKLKSVLSEIKQFAQLFVNNAQAEVDLGEPDRVQQDALLLEKRKEELELVTRYIEDIVEMRNHMLRSSFTSEERQNIIKDLGDNEALVTLDFAQKFLPTWHREKQSDYFGKKGISYHVSHVTAKIGDNYVQHNFVHIFSQDGPQDSKVVVQIIAHVASELKKVGIVSISLRSDNAGAYHCAATIQSLHWIMEKSGMAIKTYTFSEAQNGKSSSDRAIAQVKYRAERYVDQGHDITSSTEFFDAMKFDPVLNGFSFHHGKVTTEDGDPAKWTGISNLNHFDVLKNGIRAFRYEGIGGGVFMEKKELKPLKGSYDFVDAGWIASGVVPTEEREAAIAEKITKFWYHSPCTSSETCETEPDTATPETDDDVMNDIEIGNLFACPETGCSATFLSSHNLEKHVLKDQHKKSPNRLTMRDYGFSLFGPTLEGVREDHTFSIAREALNSFTETSVQTSLVQGYALPVRKTRKPFGQKVIKYLVSLFDEGLQKRARPMDPMAAALRMKTAKNSDGSKMFTVDEWKTSKQIAGFFSREAEKRRTNSKTKRATDNVAPTVVYEEYTPNADDHEDFELIKWIKDESYSPIDDEMFNATVHSKDIFDFSKGAESQSPGPQK